MNSSASDWPIASLLPHAGNMILLDEVCTFDDDHIVTRTVVKPSPYALPDGALPPWLGLELMAQTVGAWAGCQARRAGQAVKVGFLLGTRRYDCYVDALPLGLSVTITAWRSLLDANGMAVFECTLHADARCLAQARLNIYQPPDPQALLAQP